VDLTATHAHMEAVAMGKLGEIVRLNHIEKLQQGN